MSATSDHLVEASSLDAGEAIGSSVRMVNGARMIGRGIGRVAGSALLIASLGLWIMPTDGMGPETTLFRLAVSLSMGFMGLALWQAGGRPVTPEIEIDMIRREVRLVRVGGNKRALLARCKFSELARAELDGHMVKIWDSTGGFLAEIELADPSTQRRLLSALRDAGKLS